MCLWGREEKGRDLWGIGGGNNEHGEEKSKAVSKSWKEIWEKYGGKGGRACGGIVKCSKYERIHQNIDEKIRLHGDLDEILPKMTYEGIFTNGKSHVMTCFSINLK